MDKARDVGGRMKVTRFSSANRQIVKPSGLECKRLKREKVRSMSFLGGVCSNNLDSEMGSVQSDGDDEFRTRNSSTSKRFKVPKKFFDDCNTVELASVPRKLRSARKRSQESASPPLPESRMLNHTSNGVELLSNVGMKKSKLKHPEELGVCLGQATIGPISKEEEEVAETLYALAGMFSDTENTHKVDSDGRTCKEKSLSLPEAEESLPESKVQEVEKESKNPYPTAEAEAEAAPQSSKVEDSSRETLEIPTSNQGVELELNTSKQKSMELQSCISESKNPSLSLFSKSTPADETQSRLFGALNSSERRWGAGLNYPLHDLNVDCEKKKEIDVVSVAAFRSHNELQPTIVDNMNHGSALWPGLSSTKAEAQGSSLKFPTAKVPAWLGNSTSATRPCSAGSDVVAEKESRPPTDAKKSWKKCSAHVYICRLIKGLQIAEEKESLQPTQLTTLEGLKQGASEANKLHLLIKNGSSVVVPANGISSSAMDRSLNEVNNAILLHKRLLEDQQASTSTSAQSYSTQKQSFNFLSFPSGGCGMEAKTVADRPGNVPGLDASRQYQVPYMHSSPQNHTTMPISMPQNHHISTYPEHQSASGASHKVQIQLPSYLSNSVSGSFPSSMTTVFPKQQQQIQQFQQQQWFWAAQLGSAQKPGEFAAAAAHITNWQNGKHESSPSVVQYGHQLAVLGPRYPPVSPHQQQQHQFISNVSPPNMVLQRYHDHRNGGGVFRPDGAPALQLLCNERL